VSNGPPNQVLLDTHAFIWIIEGGTMRPSAVEAIVHAGLVDGVLVSPVSAWEVGMLATKPNGPRFNPDPKAWFAQALTAPAIHLAPVTPDIAINSSHLPGKVHGDPLDRMLIATARALQVPIVTRDKKILAYANAGFVQAIKC
jgi:PIN domain nuclease of toxin-antitoxin system